jgi:hypothetical protein
MSLSKAAAIATIVGGIVAVIALFKSWNMDSQQYNSEHLKQAPKIEETNKEQPSAAAIRPCTENDYHQVGWNRSEQISGSSGWVGGGSNPTNWCNQLINNSIQSRSIGPKHETRVISSSEEGRWTGIRVRQYNYHCTFLINWDPKLEKKEGVICN